MLQDTNPHAPGYNTLGYNETGTTGGASIEVSGVVKEKLGDRKVAVDVVVAAGGAKVLKRARAIVRLP